MSFKLLDGETAILQQGGVFKQADLYEWDGKLFAKHGGGFIRLKENGSTSKDGINIEMLMLDKILYKDRFGRLCVEGKGVKPLTDDKVLRLTSSGD